MPTPLITRFVYLLAVKNLCKNLSYFRNIRIYVITEITTDLMTYDKTTNVFKLSLNSVILVIKNEREVLKDDSCIIIKKKCPLLYNRRSHSSLKLSFTEVPISGDEMDAEHICIFESAFNIVSTS